MPYKDLNKQKESQHRFYMNEKEQHRLRNQKRREELRKWFLEITKDIKCEHCGEKERACLDFHHKDPKEKDNGLSQLVAEMRSKQRILDELKKCIVLCSNCHRKLHAGILKIW